MPDTRDSKTKDPIYSLQNGVGCGESQLIKVFYDKALNSGWTNALGNWEGHSLMSGVLKFPQDSKYKLGQVKQQCSLDLPARDPGGTKDMLYANANSNCSSSPWGRAARNWHLANWD